MFGSLLKKEFIRFMRHKSSLIMLMVFPVVLITTLAFGLKDVMNGDTNLFGTDDNKSVIYYSEEGDKYKDGFDAFIDVIEDEFPIEFKESTKEDAKDDVDNYKAVSFLKVSDDGFDLYTSENGDNTKSKVFKCIVDSMRNEFAKYETIAEENPMAFQNLMKTKMDSVIKDETKDLRSPTSAEYYTFAELGLIILYTGSIMAQLTYEEKKYTTVNRIRISKVSEGKMVLSKIIFGLFVGIVQTAVIYIYSSLVLNVNWGENTVPFLILFTSLSLFSSVVGVILGFICSKDTTAAGILNALIIAVCGLGGCYIPLFNVASNPVMKVVCKISPLYWVNISTSSMICGIKTYSIYVAILEPIVLSLIIVLIYLGYKVKKGVLLDD